MGSEARQAIDLVHLGTYTQGDKVLERELLTMFLPSAAGYIDVMAEGVGEGPAQESTQESAWWTAAHSLKGVALGVGAWEVAEVAAAAEGQRDAAPSVRRGAVVQARAALDRVRCFVANLT